VIVGLVGCGQWGAYVLRDLRALGCEVPVVARSEESVARAGDGGADSVVPSIDALARVDGLVVSTPIATHAAVLDEALDLGVPVFVEKPLCDDPNDAARLAAVAPDRLFVMDKWRYHPGVLALAALARDGSLGRVRGLRTLRVQPENRHAEDGVWVLAPHDLAIAIEALRSVASPVAARGVWEGDHLVTLHALLDTPLGWHALEVSERAPAVARRVELHCDEGIAVLAGGWDEHVEVHVNGAEPTRIETRGELPLLAELRAFVGFLEGGPPPRSSVADGASIVRAIDGLRALAA